MNAKKAPPEDPQKRGPGRPRTGNAMTPAERKAAQRMRMKEEGLKQYSVVLKQSDVAKLAKKLGCTESAAAELAAMKGLKK